jgi:hypothetical protein
MYAALVFAGIGLIYIAAMAFYFNPINLVIGIMGAALRVTEKSSELKRIPLLGGLFISAVCLGDIWAIFAAGSIGQVRKIDAPSNQEIRAGINGKKVKVYQFNNFHFNMVPLDFVASYYMMLFAITFVEAVSSYAITIWFFSKKKDTTKVEAR